MKITDVEFRRADNGYPFVSLKLYGKEAIIGIEQKLLKYGGVYLGPNFENDERITFVLPADPDDGRPDPWVFVGISGDPRLVRLAHFFFNATENGTFEPGPVDLDELMKGG